MATTRRDFLRNAALAGTGVGFLAFGSSAIKDIVKGPFKLIPYANAAPLDMQDAEKMKVVHSLCLGCNARCGFRARVYDGMVYKVDGNPYCMSNNYWEPLPTDTPLEESFKHQAKMCLKGQSIAHYTYDPYRIVTPLKRAGNRGEGKFKPISWEQFIKEIVEGGTIEETGEKLPGLKMYADFYVSKEEVIDAVLEHVSKDFLNKWANAIAPGKPVSDWKKFLEENIYKLWLPKEEAQKLPKEIREKLIDPEMPALGPKSNFVLIMVGRGTEGRWEFVEKFVYGTVGSTNALGHADTCQWPKWAAQIFAYDRNHVGPDIKSAEYVVAWGAALAEAFNPAIPIWTILHYRRGKGDLKVVWIDPRAHNGAVVYSHRHIMPKPGEDPAIASAIIRRIFEKQSFDRRFLENPNLEAAKEDGEVAYSNASHLVVVAPKNSTYYRKLLRASDLGIGSDNEYVVVDKATGSLKANTQSKSAHILMDEYAQAKEIPNELYDGEDIDPKRANKYPKKTKGLEVKLKDGSTVYVTTALQLLKDFVYTETTQDWCKMAGVNPDDVIKTADELAFYGKRAALVSYRGAVMHLNGAITGYLIEAINMLIGNIGHKGGMIWRVGTAKRNEGRYDLGGGRKPWGLKIHRTAKNYEETAFYYKAKMEGKKPYPAKMPWFKFVGGKYHISGAIPSMAHDYPYDQKKAGIPFAVIQYFADPLFTYPTHLQYKDLLLDTKKIGLWIALTTVIDDTSYFADYIVPDVTYAEGHTGVHALYHYFFFNAIRTAVIEPLTDKTPDGRSIQFETFCIDVGRKLGSPLWGEGGIKGMGPNEGKTYPLMVAEDFHLKQIANVVHDLESKGYKIQPNKEDVEFVEKNYPIAKYKNAVSPEEWPKVAYLLSRGGFFISYEDHFEGNLYKFPLNESGMVRFYFEDLALRRNPITGKYMVSGFPRYVSLREAGQYQGFDPDKVEQEYPFKLITYKPVVHTQSRTMNYIWALESEPENMLWINPVDAQKLGIKQGDYVKVLAPGYDDWVVDIAGRKIEYKIRAYVTNRIRQGTVAISSTYGHWCHSGVYKVPVEIQNPEKALLGLARFKDFPEWRIKALHGSIKIVDGNRLLSDPKRDTGAPYAAACHGTTLPTGVAYPLVDLYSCGAAFYSGNVKVVKA